MNVVDEGVLMQNIKRILEENKDENENEADENDIDYQDGCLIISVDFAK